MSNNSSIHMPVKARQNFFDERRSMRAPPSSTGQEASPPSWPVRSTKWLYLTLTAFVGPNAQTYTATLQLGPPHFCSEERSVSVSRIYTFAASLIHAMAKLPSLVIKVDIRIALGITSDIHPSNSELAILSYSNPEQQSRRITTKLG